MSEDECTCAHIEYGTQQGRTWSRRATYENVCPLHSPVGHMLQTPYDATWPSSCECGEFHGRPHEYKQHIAQVLANKRDQP